jgi:hypothetical protein
MKQILFGVLLVAGLVGCYSGNDARKAVEAQGFTNVETHGHAFTGCGDDDTFATKFDAISPTGKPVSGVVCSGWLKGATVRF